MRLRNGVSSLPLVLIAVVAACDTPLAPGMDAPLFSGDASLKPAAPSGLTGAAAPPAGIELMWVDESDNEAYFQVQRRMNIGGVWGAWAAAHQPAADATGVRDTGLAVDARYQYRIRACNAGGCSAYSVSTWVSTAITPVTPTSLTGAPNPGMTSIELAWTAAGSNHAGFLIQRKRQDNRVWGAYETIAMPAADARAYHDSGLTRDVRYQYRIRACNSAGCSSPLASDRIATQYGPEMHVNHSAHLAWPVPDSVRVRWEATSDSGMETVLQRRVKAGGLWGTWSTIATLPIDIVNFVVDYWDTDIVPGTGYQYRVRACNLVGCSPYIVSNKVAVP